MKKQLFYMGSDFFSPWAQYLFAQPLKFKHGVEATPKQVLHSVLIVMFQYMEDTPVHLLTYMFHIQSYQ